MEHRFFVKNKAYILIYRAYSYWNVKMYCTEKNEYDGKFSIKLSKKADSVRMRNEVRVASNPVSFSMWRDGNGIIHTYWEQNERG